IDFSLKHRPLVIIVTLALAVWGVISMQYLDVDAFPDHAPTSQHCRTPLRRISELRLQAAILASTEEFAYVTVLSHTPIERSVEENTHLEKMLLSALRRPRTHQ